MKNNSNRSRMVGTVFLVAVALSNVAAVATAQAFVDDFESYEAGSNIVGQGGWKGRNNFANRGALVSDVRAYSGSNSLEVVPGTDLIHEHDLVGGKWIISMKQYVPLANLGYAFLLLYNSYADQKPAESDVSLQTMLDLATGIIRVGRETVTSTLVVFDRWIELSYIVDLDKNTFEVYYDHIPVGAGVWDDDNHGALGAINLSSSDGLLVYYDDIKIQRYLEALGKASGPRPADDANDVVADVVLEWTPGTYAAGHDVYLGIDYDAVSRADRDHPMGVLVSENQAAPTFDPEGLLEYGQTYYWRIDEVNAPPDNTIFQGDVWSFTTEPFVYPIEDVIATSNVVSPPGQGPENTVNGSGLNADDEHSIGPDDMWLAEPGDADPVTIQFEFDRVYKLHEMLVWNYNTQFELLLGIGLRDVTVEYSIDGIVWTTLGEVELAQATAASDYTANTAIAFDGVAVRYVRLTVASTWGQTAQYGLSEVRFLYIPAHARLPRPADGETNVPVSPHLQWRPGREAVSHEIYLSTDEAAVTEGTALIDTVSEAAYAPGLLDFGQRYYWRVDEVNEAEEIPVWEGSTWSFTTQQFSLIDGFEQYDDEDNLIFDTWIDGWINETGSTVGHMDAPFAERSIVHSGRQSMPLHYDNRKAPFYSETERDLGDTDWTRGQADTLSLFVAGRAPAFAELPDGTILMNGYGKYLGSGWDEDRDEFRYTYQELLGDGSITVRVDNLVHTSDLAAAGVMIRENLLATSKHAAVLVSPPEEVSFWQRRANDGESDHTSEYGFSLPHWVKLTRTGPTLAAEHSTDGANWSSIAGDSTTEISMTDRVYIGLIVTSGHGEVDTSAEFSNLTITGEVTGDWQTVGVGIAQVPGNSIEPLYVAVEDSAGQVATATHPDPFIVGRTGWHQWQIPYSAFGRVDMASIRKVYIGVGDHDHPIAGGTGTIYIDDLAIGRP